MLEYRRVCNIYNANSYYNKYKYGGTENLKKYFAVADVHSYYDELQAALSNAKFDVDDEDHILIICGDLFDRGEQTVECYNFVKDLVSKGRVIYVRGNHEDLLMNCITQVRWGEYVDNHHITNGTVKTLANFCGVSEWDIICNVIDYSTIESKVNELIKFIDFTSCDYFPLNNTIFVHGWIPWNNSTGDKLIKQNWQESSLAEWKKARWSNGMQCFMDKLVPENVTVVCGHWHASWGWANIKHEGTEWGETALFDPFVASNDKLNSQIIALDACTAYSHKINCVVFDKYGIIIT